MTLENLLDIAQTIYNNMDSWNNSDHIWHEDYCWILCWIMETINKWCDLWLIVPDWDTEEFKSLLW